MSIFIAVPGYQDTEFIPTIENAFSKADPLATGNPFLHESEHYHYYNIEHHSEEDNKH